MSRPRDAGARLAQALTPTAGGRPMTRQGPGVDGTHEPRTPGQAHVLVAHDGGPRAGQVAPVPAHLLAGWLVYDGPVWMGVYGRSDPPRVLPTDAGDAEVWTVCQ